jgi:hypothetical protein
MVCQRSGCRRAASSGSGMQTRDNLRLRHADARQIQGPGCRRAANSGSGMQTRGKFRVRDADARQSQRTGCRRAAISAVMATLWDWVMIFFDTISSRVSCTMLATLDSGSDSTRLSMKAFIFRSTCGANLQRVSRDLMALIY